MATRRDFPILRNGIHHGHSSFGSLKVFSAVAFIGLGAGVFFFLPDDSDSQSPVASAAASAPETTAAPDESLCDKQAWPYVDQRCAKRVEAARGTRQVRIVTDKGHSVTTVTPLPIVEPKKPAAPAPVVAQTARPIGPPVAPAGTESPAQTETVAAAPQPAPTAQVTVAPANGPATIQTVARETNPSAEPRTTATVGPSAASTAPMAPGVDAFADAGSRKSKSARAAEKAEKREAKRQKAIENNGDVPDDVVATVKSLPAGGQNGRRARGAPDEVARAVEEATADSRRGRRVITIGSPNGGQRIYVVPREDASGGW